MRIHRLIPVVVVLCILAATTMTTIQHRLIGVKSVSAQQSPVQSDGTSSVVAQDTTDKVDTDLYLDADEVERRAAEEQAADSRRQRRAAEFQFHSNTYLFPYPVA